MEIITSTKIIYSAKDIHALIFKDLIAKGKSTIDAKIELDQSGAIVQLKPESDLTW